MPEFKTKELGTQLKSLPVPISVEEVQLQREQLLFWKSEVDIDIQRISQQINKAKADAYQGNYSDPGWFQRVNGALHAKKQASQKIQNHLTKLKRLRHELLQTEDERGTQHKDTISAQDPIAYTSPKEVRTAAPILILKKGTHLIQCYLIEDGKMYKITTTVLENGTDELITRTFGSISKKIVDRMFVGLETGE